MAIRISGEIQIKAIQGRFGEFKTGVITTDIGIFKAKRGKLLDSFAAGTYQADFVISKIVPSSIISNGIVIVEIQAEVLDIQVHQATPDKQDKPVEKTAPPTSSTTSSQTAKVATVKPSNSTVKTKRTEPSPKEPSKPHPTDEKIDEPVDESKRALFSHLWPLGQTVKLDSTVDRNLLRQQVAALRSMGYQPNAADQTWQKQPEKAIV